MSVLSWAARPTVNKVLALGGVVIIMLQAFFIAGRRMELTIILVGIIVNQIGVWNMASRLLPDRRVFNVLRGEVDRFIDIVRKLNRKAVESDAEGVVEAKREMHESVERIGEAAGVVGENTTAYAPTDS